MHFSEKWVLFVVETETLIGVMERIFFHIKKVEILSTNKSYIGTQL